EPPTTTQEPTTTKFTTPTKPPTTTQEPTTTKFTTPTTTPCIPTCEWSEWYDVNNPQEDRDDLETYENIINHGKQICRYPTEIDCRATDAADMDFNDFVSHTGQVVTCDINYGLKCRKEDQVKPPKKCFNYKIKVCCPVVTCETTTAITTTQEPTTTTTFTSTEPPTTTQEPTTTTTFTSTEPPTTTQEPTTTTTF
ncbi:mucin-2-like, partial [Pempheris klunzingeri]|uniref:mucin-2-like n=1 Tax=Pempheris klunzingeri TaxID=3127111 RepID=UPI00397FF4E2